MERRKVVLYNPRAVFYTMPLALVAVGSALDPARYDVRIVDGRLENDRLRAVLAELDGAVCLGISVLTGDPINDALEVSRHVKRHRPDLPIVWGGWHPSLFPTGTLAEPSIDVTVQGQGEATFADVVDRLASGAGLDDVAGIAWRQDGSIVQNPPRPMIDMNDLVPARYDLIDVERFFRLKRKRQFDYISSTGCFFRCAFCADPFVYGRSWTGLAPERIADEVGEHWRRYRFDDLAFQDETFFTYADRAATMAEEFIRRGLKFTWTATMRADQGVRLGEDVFATCVRSGLRWLLVGVESGDQSMLDWMEKDVKIEEIISVAEMCARHGVQVNFPFIVGFPGESDESVDATLSLVKRLRSMSPKFDTNIFYYKPYPGSRIAEDVVRTGSRLPQTLEEWADFDYVGSVSGPWVSPQKHRLIERFKFYSRIAWGAETLMRWPLQRLARWRCRHDYYDLPIEKSLIERLKPMPKLS